MTVTVLLGLRETTTLPAVGAVVSWDERGCAQANITVLRTGAGDTLDWEFAGLAARPFMPIAIALDGVTIWDGFVDAIEVDDMGELTSVRASGWTSAPLGYATAPGGMPLDAIGKQLVRETSMPVQLVGKASVSAAVEFSGTWADWCERMRRMASDAGFPILVQAMPERMVVIREYRPRTKPDVIAPPRFRRQYPSAREIASTIVATSQTGTVTVANPQLAAFLGREVLKTLTVRESVSVDELRRIALAELHKSDGVPSCTWHGTEPWQAVTGEQLPAWLLRPGMAVLVPRIGVLEIQAVELDCFSREARVTFGRPSPEREVLRQVRVAVTAAVMGRSAVTWR